jgi:hypothetical protein
MFDEVQISKHLDFRPDLGKTVGFIDYEDLTLEHTSSTTQGDHVLVFCSGHI